MFYDAFSQDIFLGHLPWNCIFCPGPAYPGTGPVGLQFGSASGSGARSSATGLQRLRAEQRFLRGRSQSANTLYAEFQSQCSAATGQQSGVANRVCGIEGNQAVPVPGHQPAQPGSRLQRLIWPIGVSQLRRAAAVCKFLLSEPGEVFGQLHLSFAANQSAHQQLARAFYAGEFCVVARH